MSVDRSWVATLLHTSLLLWCLFHIYSHLRGALKINCGSSLYRSVPSCVSRKVHDHIMLPITHTPHSLLYKMMETHACQLTWTLSQSSPVQNLLTLFQLHFLAGHWWQLNSERIRLNPFSHRPVSNHLKWSVLAFLHLMFDRAFPWCVLCLRHR